MVNSFLLLLFAMKNPSSRLWKDFSNSILLPFLLLFVCGWVIMILINYFYTTIAIFSVIAIFATLVNYPVRWLCDYLSKGVAITITFMVTLAIVMVINFIRSFFSYSHCALDAME